MCVCVCVCVVIPFILDVRFVDVPAGVIQEEGHTGYLHLRSAVFASFFFARTIQSFLSLVEYHVLVSSPLTACPLATKSPFLLMMTNPSQTTRALHPQSQPPDFGSCT